MSAENEEVLLDNLEAAEDIKRVPLMTSVFRTILRVRLTPVSVSVTACPKCQEIAQTLAVIRRSST